MKRVCVFCGANRGALPIYAQTARATGAGLARAGLGVVYGAGKVGLMGALAKGAIDAGGNVIGVIPQPLLGIEPPAEYLTELRIVGTMHERKALMAELADAFIALPGGFGTMDELFEMLTWSQLGLHAKPCGLLNVERYYDPLIAFLDHAHEQRFVRAEHRAMVLVDDDLDALLEQIATHESPKVSPLIDAAAV